jgi:hypothetical protein
VGPFFAAPSDPEEILMGAYASTSPRHNWGGTPIAEMADLDARFVKQRRLLTLDERIKEIKEIQRVMADSFLIVPTHGPAAFTYAQPWVRNYHAKQSLASAVESNAKAWFTEERITRG